MVQYEDRSKLMHNSHSTIPEFQVVPETKAENLVVRDSERILKESGYPRLNFNPGSKVMHKENRRGTDLLVPQNPLILGGGIKKDSSSNINNRKMGNEVGTKVPPLKEGKMKSKIMRMYSLFCQVMQNPFRNKFGKSFLLKNRNFACFWGFIYLRLGVYIVIMETN